jgi:hypothetical protein
MLLFGGGIKRSLERSADRDRNSGAGFRLSEPNACAVITGPREPQQIALALAGPPSEQQRQMKMGRRAIAERGFVVGSPNLIRS